MSKYSSYTYHTSASAPQTRRAAASAPPAPRTAASPSPRGQSVRNSIQCDCGACRPAMASPRGLHDRSSPCGLRTGEITLCCCHIRFREPFGWLNGLPASNAAARWRLHDGGDDPRRIFCCGGAIHAGESFEATEVAAPWPRRGRCGSAASQKGVTSWEDLARVATVTNERWRTAPMETSHGTSTKGPSHCSAPQ